MGIRFRGIDSHCLLKPLNGFRVLMPLLVNEPELILRLSVVRVYRCRLQHSVKVLAIAEAGAEIADLTRQIVVGVEEEEGRSDPTQHKLNRPPQEGGDHERYPRQAHHSNRN